ncbi:hypothetical protein KP509_32G047300 [Ceratopteris richardii]|uniref:Uncharacterized protein n=1 Tax=Ceratopteris richardii TaxID=49495 RepID=A0A8T2QUK4_CERRI|nr:hypothetical protein KP509_32G047300 [Ceratopteris richardii]
MEVRDVRMSLNFNVLNCRSLPSSQSQRNPLCRPRESSHQNANNSSQLSYKLGHIDTGRRKGEFLR